MKPYEKLGAFYLGKSFDRENAQSNEELILYDSKDLTTHAVCVGMTGSGKTGLCVSLLEEAAIDGIPAIAIDPKGDLGNLMLTFPQLRPQDFRPWIDESAAARKGMSADEYAADRANLWKNGLKKWDQDGSRIRRLREAADIAIYTPGGDAGLPLTVLRTLNAPPPEILDDAEAMRDRVGAVVSGLLTLIGVDADPIQSREHIFLANLVDKAWRSGRNLDIAGLIQGIQSPPFERLGVIDIESFFPAKERFKLAMTLNNLLASPGFATWMKGEPLDINRLLHTPEGKPRIAILSIAHLSDAERMFFVTVLLNEVVSWMRTQPGTGSLRALLYMDEIFGYFPPTANPPSKTPMLTLLKQARAYGLGVVLATQNPVDLDYKGLSNTGTWFVGRLQAERDKLRLLDGLEGAATASGAQFDRSEMETILSGLGSRVFLMNNVHEDAPVLFHTRWAMSFLRGPLTRTQIRELMARRKATASTTQPAIARTNAATTRKARNEHKRAAMPTLPAGVPYGFLPPNQAAPPETALMYEPSLLGVARLHYVHRASRADEWKDIALFAEIDETTIKEPWLDAVELPGARLDLDNDGDDNAGFGALPAEAARKTTYKKWSKKLANRLYRERGIPIFRCKELKAYSKPGESEGDFRVRLRQLLREDRDRKIEKLRKRYASKLNTLEERIRRAQDRVAREKSQMKQQGLQTAISVGSTILGALFGRKKASVGNVGRAATTLRRAGRTAKERGDVARAKENVTVLQQKLADMEHDLQMETREIRDSGDVELLDLKEITVKPRKSDIDVETVSLAWTPSYVGPDGRAQTAFEPS